MRIIATVLNLVLPGLGCAIRGQYARSLVACALLTGIAIAGLTLSWVEYREGWLTLLALYIAVGITLSLGLTETYFRSLRALTASATFFSALATVSLTIFYVQPLTTGYSLYLIPSDSMSPTLTPGDIVLARKIKKTDQLSIGEIVIFNDTTNEKLHYIKRIAQKPFALRHSSEDQYFVIGDNYEHSLDSRYMGLISRDRIGETAKIILLNAANLSRQLIELPIRKNRTQLEDSLR